MALVLCTGTDSALMRTRMLVLERAGHTVMPAATSREIASSLLSQKFDVVVIGQAADTVEKLATMKIIRSICPTARVLELYSSYRGWSLDDADAWLEMPPENPEQFSSMVDLLASKAPRHAD